MAQTCCNAEDIHKKGQDAHFHGQYTMKTTNSFVFTCQLSQNNFLVVYILLLILRVNHMPAPGKLEYSHIYEAAQKVVGGHALPMFVTVCYTVDQNLDNYERFMQSHLVTSVRKLVEEQAGYNTYQASVHEKKNINRVNAKKKKASSIREKSLIAHPLRVDVSPLLRLCDDDTIFNLVTEKKKTHRKVHLILNDCFVHNESYIRFINDEIADFVHRHFVMAARRLRISSKDLVETYDISRVLPLRIILRRVVSSATDVYISVDIVNSKSNDLSSVLFGEDLIYFGQDAVADL